MPFACRIDGAHRVGIVQLSGSVTGDELAAALSALAGDPAWQRGFDELWDGRFVTQLVLDLSEVRRIVGLARLEQERLGPGRAAMITSRDVVYVLARLFGKLLSTPRRELRVFRSMEDALAWLKLPPGMLASDDAVRRAG